MPFGYAHDAVCFTSRIALYLFYKEIAVFGTENVPREGPLIVAATHHNMIVDAAILSISFPHGRRVHYWAKDSLFANPIIRGILVGGGVVPVDRRTRNNTLLYRATYEVLGLGEIVGVFPEGTSHTLPRLKEFKDGVSWAALEYARSILPHLRAGAASIKDGHKVFELAPVVPAGIIYTDKSKYRSTVIVSFGEPIAMEAYLDDFLKDEKVTAKRLTADIEKAIMKLTINAPDWESLRAAHMARTLLFPVSVGLLAEYVPVTQSLVNVFVNLSPTRSDVQLLQADLLAYREHLTALKLSDTQIAVYSTRTLDPTTATLHLLKHTLLFLIVLPLFLPGLLAHFPLYVLGKLAAQSEIYEEVRAQNKIFAGILLVPLTYVIVFFYIWNMWFATSFTGLLFSVVTVPVLAWYHTTLVDERYGQWKELVGAWRMFDAVVLGRGMWMRKKRIEDARRARERGLRGVRAMVKRYKGEEQDVRVVWEALRRIVAGEAGKKGRKGLEWVRED